MNLNEEILKSIKEIEALNEVISKDADVHPLETRAGAQVAQKQALTRLPYANLELKNLLLKKAVKILAVGEDFNKVFTLAEQLSKQGLPSLTCWSYYHDLASKLPWNSGNGLSAEAFAILQDYLREDCRRYGTYAFTTLEFPNNRSVNTFNELVVLVHDVVSKAFGENLDAAYQLTVFTNLAVAKYKWAPELVEEPLIFTVPCLTNEQAVLLSSLMTPDKFSMIVDLTGEEVSKSVVMKAYQKMYQNLLKSGTIQEVKPEKK